MTTLTYPTRDETALARVSALYADTDDEEIGRKARLVAPEYPAGFARPTTFGAEWWAADAPGEPAYYHTADIPLGVLGIVYASANRSEALVLAAEDVSRWLRPSGITVDGRTVYPFNVRVEHETEVVQRRPEVGWSSDGTHTPPRYDHWREGWVG